MPVSHVLVAGAGIGGLATALALSRIGCAVTLVERRTGFSDEGAGIQLSPNASRVLIDLGLAVPLQRLASAPERIVIRNLRSGRIIGGVSLGASAAQRHGAPFLVIARGDLQLLLLDAVRSAGVALLMGRRASSLTQDGEAACLTVENAAGERQQIGADLVVGADGLWSSLRSVLGHGVAASSGYTAWRTTLLPETLPPEFAENEIGLWLGKAAHAVHYPIADGRRLNVVAVIRQPDPGEGWSFRGDPAVIGSRFADADTRLRGLIANADEWRAWPLRDLRPHPAAQGRLALVGDAAHPVLPFMAQGGAMAIEDAAVLAQALAASPDVAQATSRYARERLARARRIHAAARRNGLIYHLTGPAAFARDLVIRRLGPDGMLARHDWLYGWRAAHPA